MGEGCCEASPPGSTHPRPRRWECWWRTAHSWGPVQESLQPEEAALPSVSVGAAKDRRGPKACPFSMQGGSRTPSGQSCFLSSLMRVCPREASVHTTYCGLFPENGTYDGVERDLSGLSECYIKGLRLGEVISFFCIRLHIHLLGTMNTYPFSNFEDIKPRNVKRSQQIYVLK